jgi:hypothetical protein
MTNERKKEIEAIGDQEWRQMMNEVDVADGLRPERRIFTIMPSVKQNISFFGAAHETILYVTEEGEFNWCANPEEAILAMEAAGTNKPIAALLRRLRDYENQV